MGSPRPWSDCLRNYVHGIYSSVICQMIWTVDYGGAVPRRRWCYNWWFRLVSVGGGGGGGFIHGYHDSIFAGHLGVSRTVCRLLARVYWPGLCEDVRSYLASCSMCLARKSPFPRQVPMGHVLVGHRWDLVVMDILDQGCEFENHLMQ